MIELGLFFQARPFGRSAFGVPSFLGALTFATHLLLVAPAIAQEAPDVGDEPAPEAESAWDEAPEVSEDEDESVSETSPPSEAPAAVEPLEAPEKPKKKKRKASFSPRVRLITRGEFSRREEEIFTAGGLVPTQVEALDLALQRVRVGFRYRSPIKGLSANVSVELTRRARLRNAYVQYKGENLGTRVGRFRVPASPFEAEGRRWLPTTGRGFVNEILKDRLEIGGRRTGVSVFAFGDGDLKPRITLGAFQGSFLDDEATRGTSVWADQLVGVQAFVGRADLGVGDVNFGVHASSRVGTDSLPRPGVVPGKFWAGGADVKLDTTFRSSGLRIWADVNTGESWFTVSEQGGTATFLATRLMAAFRAGGVEKGEFYVEPYAMVGGLDPDLRVSADLASEIAFGANVGFWRMGRLSLQAEAQRTDRNFPDEYVLGYYKDRRALIAQLLMEF